MKPRATRIWREETVHADGSRSTRECRSERMYQQWRALALPEGATVTAERVCQLPNGSTVTFLIGTITWEEA